MKAFLLRLVAITLPLFLVWYYIQSPPQLAGVTLNIIGYTNDTAGIRYAQLNFTNGSSESVKLHASTNVPAVLNAWVLFQQPPGSFNFYQMIQPGQSVTEVTLQPGEDISFSVPVTNKGPHSVALDYLPLQSSWARELYQKLEFQISGSRSEVWGNAQTPFVDENGKPGWKP